MMWMNLTRVPMIMLVLAAGCAAPRSVTISTKPPDAIIKIDGVEQGRAPVSRELAFDDPAKVHVVTASRRGYKDGSVQLTREDTRKQILIELKPLTRVIHFSVEPVPGILRINGEQVSPDSVAVYSKELPFVADERNNWTSYVVTAERTGFQTARTIVSWPDNSPNYTLKLEPLVKDLRITTEPPGAQVTLDGETLGTTPLVDPGRSFPVDIDTNQFLTHALKLEKPGYDTVELDLGWDDGKTDYHVDFKVKTKQVRIITDPPEAKVRIEGAKPDRAGAMTVYTLTFIPSERGELPTYKGIVTREPGASEWEPAEFTIAWDDQKEDYSIKLKEIVTRPTPLTVATMRRTEQGWECVPEQLTTMAFKDVMEGSTRPSPTAVTRLDKGASIGSMAMAPDGSKVLFTVLSGNERNNFRSRMVVVPTDGSGSAEYLTDGRTLDITPSFTPGGDQILFSSNRAGRRLQIWSMSATAQPGVTRLITSETHDLWSSLDSDPKPRMFYQSMVDTRPDSRIFMTPMGTVSQTDLTLQSGTQPRISARNDSILFCSVNEETGKRDIYRMSDRGGSPQNLTNTPDADECDPVWSRDGTMIAFASDRGVDPAGRHNYDIWVLNLSKPSDAVQITVNGSRDDNPLFDPTGSAIYFRSNRGGEWGIWKASLR